MRPRTPSYEELPPHAQEDIKAEFKAYVDSRPPPTHLAVVKRRVIARVERDARTHDRSLDTGRHDVEELSRLLREKIERDAAEKLTEERERRKEMQLELARAREKADEELREMRKLLGERTEKRWDRKWGLFALLLTALVSSLLGRYIGPSSIPAEPPTETH